MASNKNASIMELYSVKLKTLDKNSYDIYIENNLYASTESTKTIIFNSKEAYENTFKTTNCKFWSVHNNEGFEIADIIYHLDGKVSIILKKHLQTKRGLRQ